MYRFLPRILLVIFLVSAVLNIGTPALFAQEQAIKISGLQTEILPEYDTPDILVINTIQLQNTSTADYTGEFRWIVPKGSKTHIVIDGEERLAFNLAETNGNSELVWKLTKPLKAGETREIHLEFYYNNLQGSVDKSFTFAVSQYYPISSGQIYVVQPTKATNFKLTPEMGPAQSAAQSGQQITFYQKSYADLQPGQELSFAVAYTKQDPNPSFSPPSASTNPAQTPNQNDNVSSDKGFDQNIGIFVIAGLLIIVVLLAVKIISNNKRLAEFSDEDDEEEDDDDEDDEDDEDDDDISSNPNSRRAKIERDFKAGLITEEEYTLLMLEE